MNYEQEIGTHLANLIVEMISIAEEGERVTGFELDHVKSMDAFQKAAPVYKQKALKAYEGSFDKHEHEGQAKAHEHGMNAAREVFVRMKKNAKASSQRRDRDSAMRDMGMTKVRGAQSGKTYWESFNVAQELGLVEELDLPKVGVKVRSKTHGTVGYLHHIGDRGKAWVSDHPNGNEGQYFYHDDLEEKK